MGIVVCAVPPSPLPSPGQHRQWKGIKRNEQNIQMQEFVLKAHSIATIFLGYHSAGCRKMPWGETMDCYVFPDTIKCCVGFWQLIAHIGSQ